MYFNTVSMSKNHVVPQCFKDGCWFKITSFDPFCEFIESTWSAPSPNMTCDDFALNDVWRLPRSSVKRYYLGSWGWSSCGLYNPTKWARSCDHKSILIFQVIFELGAGHVLSINSQFWFLCTLHTYFQLTCVSTWFGPMTSLTVAGQSNTGLVSLF